MSSFANRLTKNVQERRSQIVVGLDPNLNHLWPGATDGLQDSLSVQEQAACAVKNHCFSVLEAVADLCVAVKPQVACFERLGAPGWSVLAEVTVYAQKLGLLVIADAKRGDIDVSAQAYSQAMFGTMTTPFGVLPSLGADAMTVSPYLGRDSLTPIVETAQQHHGGVFVLVRTSNPGGADLQDLQLANGEHIWEQTARIVNELEQSLENNLTSVGAVVGATVPAHLVRARELMPNAIFLLPGVGAQGGQIQNLAPAFRYHPAGGLIAVSRSIVNAWEKHPDQNPGEAAKTVTEQLRKQAWEISTCS